MSKNKSAEVFLQPVRGGKIIVNSLLYTFFFNLKSREGRLLPFLEKGTALGWVVVFWVSICVISLVGGLARSWLRLGFACMALGPVGKALGSESGSDCRSS